MTNPPTLSPFDPPIQHSPIVSQVLNFDEIEAVHDQQTSGYPWIEDISSLDRRPDVDTTMEDVVEISNVVAFDNPIDIEIAFWKTSLDGCKDALPLLRSSEDNEDDEGHEKQSDVRLPSHLNITGVVSSQASLGSDPTVPECSKQGGQDPHAQEEHNMSFNAVGYKMDVYEAAMCDPSDGGADAFFCLEHLSRAANVPHNKVRLFFPFFHNVKMRAIPCHLFFFSYLFSIS